MTKDDPETEAQRKELADIIYRINPFAVSRMGKEGRAIANLAMAFRESTAPEFNCCKTLWTICVRWPAAKLGRKLKIENSGKT